MERGTSGEDALRQDQDAIAGFFRLAFREVSTALGGEELATTVEGLPTDIDSLWPANALRFLEDQYPGAAEAVFSRAESIQAEAHDDGANTQL